MRSFALFTTIALTLAAFPFVAADHEGKDDHAEPAAPGQGDLLADQVSIGGDEASPESLQRRIAALESLLSQVLAGTAGGEIGEPCTPSVGCVKLPLYVDEDGDEMTGELWMNQKGIRLLPPPPATDSEHKTGSSFLNATGFEIHAPTNFTDEVKLEPHARLNTTGGAEVFIDFFGNLTFADGSFINPAAAALNQPVTFTEEVKIFKNITVIEGANIIFQNNTGILQQGSFSRIGTTTGNPFYIVANNTTAVAIWPAPSQAGAANLVMGHPDNNITQSSDIGNFIGGGGSASGPNTIEGLFNFIMGGEDNQIVASHSVAGGQGARALHDNSFVWNDGGAPVSSTAINTFVINATGGVGIGTASPTSALTVNGDITPATNGTRALGAPDARWHLLYLASQIDFANELVYTSNGLTVMTLTDDGSVTIPGTVNVGTLTGDASGLTGITAASIADGSITGAKLAAGSVGSNHLADASIQPWHMGVSCAPDEAFVDSGEGWDCLAISNTDTLAELSCLPDELARSGVEGIWYCSADFDTDTLGGLSCSADGIARTGPEGGWFCSVDIDTDTLAGLFCSSSDIIRSDGEGSWFCSTDSNSDTLADLVCAADQIPVYDDLAPAWLCGDDSDTTYGAGFGLSLTGGTFDADSSVLQRRVAATCPAGSSIRAIAQDGTIICETDDNTVYVAGQGIEIIGSEIGILDTVTQRRVTGTCAPGAAIRAIAQDGTVTCETATTDAQTLDGLDSTQFVRRDVSDSFDGAVYDMNGVLRVWGDLEINGLVDSDIIPNFDTDYDLGSADHHFKELYLSGDIFYPYQDIAFQSGTTGKKVSFDDVGNVLADGNTIALGYGQTDATRQIYFFEDGSSFGEHIAWDDVNDRFEFSDEVLVNGQLRVEDHVTINRGGTLPERLYFGDDQAHWLMWAPADDRFHLNDNVFISSGSLGVNDVAGPQWGTNSRYDAGSIDTNQAYGGVKGTGFNIGVQGYLGANGANDFDGHTSADWFGKQIGAAGIADNGGSNNIGVMGHGSGVGVRGENVASPNANYAELGLPGIGLRARGTSLAAEFLHDISVKGTSGTDNDDIFFDDGVTEFLQWNDGLQRFRFTDDLEVDTLVMQGSTLSKGGGQLRWDGTDVCLASGNCAAATGIKVVAANDVQLSAGSIYGDTGPGAIRGRTAEKTLNSMGPTSFCRNAQTLYWHFGADSCTGGTVAFNDLRLAPGGGFAAYSFVAGSDPDFGLSFASDAGLIDGGSELDYYDADGNGLFNYGDSLVTDTNGDSFLSVNDFVIGGPYYGQVITAGHPLLNVALADPVANQGSFALDTAGAFWDLMPNGSWTPKQDEAYIDISEG